MRIKELRKKKVDLTAALVATLAASRNEGRSATAEERAKFDAIEAELAAVNVDIQIEERALDAERALADPSATSIVMGENRAESRPWGPRMPDNASARVVAEVQRAALGEFCVAVARAQQGHGFDPRLGAVATGMNTVNGSDGGWAVPGQVAEGIERSMFEGGEILSRVDAREITGDSMTYNLLKESSRATGSRAGGVQGFWVDQGGAPDPSTFKLERLELRLRKVAALGYMTDELVADAAALGGELEVLFNEELTFQVEDAIWEGKGGGQPVGWSNASCAVTVSKETNQGAATIVPANLSKMWARMPARSKKRAIWFYNVDVEPNLDALTLPAGTAGLQPRFVDYSAEGVLRIKGRPCLPVEYASTIGTKGDIMLVDPFMYRLIKKGGVQHASSIHVRFTQGEQTFRATYRCDGAPAMKSAITPFKGSDTLSAFVQLETRG